MILNTRRPNHPSVVNDSQPPVLRFRDIDFNRAMQLSPGPFAEAAASSQTWSGTCYSAGRSLGGALQLQPLQLLLRPAHFLPGPRLAMAGKRLGAQRAETDGRANHCRLISRKF
ncbi:unnamed protein product [Polarella glacialis]|uniref:Uncharacterized protein n=1 Tax=Polarella glacialis TaxID=89957 RepID=A0A813G1G2_POLGL|nr:unnamed protein product [Polarella glacialis]